MRGISFELKGKMAHFRKYYSNSTALSYMVPPITTVKGIIAGLLGYERDTYYKIFSQENCKVSIMILAKIKKVTQTMNLLKIEQLNHLNGAGLNRTQNDTEFIIPQDIRKDAINYRIIIWHQDEIIMNKLAGLICHQNQGYLSKGISVSLGSAQCQGWIQNGRQVEMKAYETVGEEVKISGMIDIDAVDKIEIKGVGHLDLIKEETFTEFNGDRYLTVGSKKRVIINLSSDPLQVILKKGTVVYQTDQENLMLI